MKYDPEKHSIAKHVVTAEYDISDDKIWIWTTQPIEKCNEQFGGHLFAITYNDAMDLVYLIYEAIAAADAFNRLNRDNKQ